MEEIFRTNDIVKLSFIEHLLSEAGLPYFIADKFISAVEGNIGAFGRRVMVHEDIADQAREAIAEVEPG